MPIIFVMKGKCLFLDILRPDDVYYCLSNLFILSILGQAWTEDFE